MDRNYGGVIWTDHAMQRLMERGIKQSDAYATFTSPRESRFAKTKNAYVYFRDWGNDQLEVVAAKNEQGQWIILSVWSKPINQPVYKIHVKPVKFDNLLEKFLQKTLGKFKKVKAS